MLFHNNICKVANQRIPVLQQQICREFLQQPKDTIVGTLQKLFSLDNQVMYKYAGEAYKLFVTNGLCSSEVWNKRYFEFATYGMALSNMFMAYDIDKDEMKLYTSSYSILQGLASRGILVQKKDSLASEMDKFKHVLCCSKQMTDSIKKGMKLQVVRLEPSITGTTVKFTGQVPRSQLDLNRCLIIPVKAIESCMKLLNDFLQSHLVEIAQGDKVRVVTKDINILRNIYGEERANQLLKFVYNPYVNQFYIPSVGASTHTLGVTNIKLADIDYIKPISLAEVDLSNVTLDLTLVSDYYKQVVENLDKHALDHLAKYLGIYNEGDVPQILKAKCLGVHKKDSELYKIMQNLSNLFDIEEFKRMPNKYGDLNEVVPVPFSLDNLYALFNTGVFKVVSTSKKGGMVTNIITMNKSELRRVLGADYVGKFESEGYRLGVVKNILYKYEGDEVLVKDLEGLERVYRLGLGTETPISKLDLLRVVDSRLDDVACRTTSGKSPNSITVRNCRASLDYEGRCRDFYKQLSLDSVVSITRLSNAETK